jgi:hypothetical protein
MKTKVKLIILILMSLFLTSCIDIFHAVSLDKGNAKVTIRYTIQKGMLETIGSMSGEAMDFSEFTDIGDEIFGEFDNIEAQVAAIDTSSQLGAEVKFSGKVSDLVSELEDSMFLPIKTETGYEISIPSLNEGEESDEMSLAFMSGSNYTLLLDLSGDMKNVRTARLKSSENSADIDSAGEIIVNIYGSSMMVEIPIILLFISESDIVIELVQ